MNYNGYGAVKNIILIFAALYFGVLYKSLFWRWMFHFCVSCNIWESVKLSRDNSSSVSANRGSRLWIWISLVLTVSLDLLSGVCSPTMTDGPWKMWGCRNGGICATGCVALYPKRICLGMRVWEAGAAVWAICFSSYSLTGFWKAPSLNIKSTGSLLGALKIFAELHSQTLYTFFCELKHFSTFSL